MTSRAGVRIEKKSELHGRILLMVDQAMGSLDVLQALAAIVALIAVGAAIAQAAFERRGDVAALRALGLTRRQGAAMLYAEAVATALPGAILGLLAGLLLGLVFAAATRTLGIPVPFVPPWRTLFGAALAAVFGSLAATALPARRLRGVSAVEALRRE